MIMSKCVSSLEIFWRKNIGFEFVYSAILEKSPVKAFPTPALFMQKAKQTLYSGLLYKHFPHI